MSTFFPWTSLQFVLSKMLLSSFENYGTVEGIVLTCYKLIKIQNHKCHKYTLCNY